MMGPRKVVADDDDNHNNNHYECDYLVVGSGATGMAFVDVLLTQSDTKIIMIDQHKHPGGHWVDAYKFVKLHQPALWYGVPSMKLERHGQANDLSNGYEILDYYQRVLKKFIDSGRVQYYTECTYLWNEDNSAEDNNSSAEDKKKQHCFVDNVTGAKHYVTINKKLVDTTYTQVSVPSTRQPSYKVEPNVQCYPINYLYKNVHVSKKHYIIVGAGKTGCDAVLYLLNNGIPQTNITWIVSRDPWFINRNMINDHKNGRSKVTKGITAVACPHHDGGPEWTDSLLIQESIGFLFRLDPNVVPTKYSCATVDLKEIQQLRSIDQVIRHGRITSISKTHMNFESSSTSATTGTGGKGISVPVPYHDNANESSSTIFIDCTACGLKRRPPVDIWQNSTTTPKIVLQPIFICQAVSSAALIAFVEQSQEFVNDEERNSIVKPISHPNSINDSLLITLEALRNMILLNDDPRISNKFWNNCRLNNSKYMSSWYKLKLIATVSNSYLLMKQLSTNVGIMKIQYNKLLLKQQQQQQSNSNETETETERFPQFDEIINLKEIQHKLTTKSYQLLCITILFWLFVMIVLYYLVVYGLVSLLLPLTNTSSSSSSSIMFGGQNNNGCGNGGFHYFLLWLSSSNMGWGSTNEEF